MKHIVFTGERNYIGETLVTLGANTYEIEKDWLKWDSEEMPNASNNAVWASDGFLYAATGKKEYPVAVIDKEGNFIKALTATRFGKSHSIAESLNGTLLVADASKNDHVVHEIDKEGNLLRTWGTPGVPSDSGYDFDAWKTMEPTGRVPEETPYSKKPEANARIQSVVRRGGPFNRPCDFIQVPDGEYYAADGYGNCAVHRFNKDGELIQSWGEPGKEFGAFRVVHAVLLDRFDRLWVTARENMRVQAFSRNGELLAAAYGNLTRIGRTCTDGKYLYIGELDGGISAFDLETLEPVGQIGAPKSFMRCHGLTPDPEGNLYISSNVWNPKNIIRLRKVQ
ncbi:MAG: hypothetical protein IJ130_13185 [Solobacterium sp.]|nr:hypothetical protein [Solobacterium sp.]